MLGGGDESLVQAYFSYLGQIVQLDFGISTSNYPTNVSEVIARTLPYSIFLVGVAFILAFVVGTTVGMIAAWRRGGAVDNVVVPTLLSLSAFPAFFTSLVAVYFFGLKLGWFPLQHAYDTELDARLQLHVPGERVPPRAAADPRHHGRVRAAAGCSTCAR